MRKTITNMKNICSFVFLFVVAFMMSVSVLAYAGLSDNTSVYGDTDQNNKVSSEQDIFEKHPIQPAWLKQYIQDHGPIAKDNYLLKNGGVDGEFVDTVKIDDVVIRAEANYGVLPEGASLYVEKLEHEKRGNSEINRKIRDISDAVKARSQSHTAKSYIFDIMILDKNGNEVEPDGNVRLSFKNELVKDKNLETKVFHVKEDGNDLSAKELTSTEEKDTVHTVTDSFSYYTVEFTYASITYVMDGDSTIPVSDILDKIGLSGEVTYAEGSNDELFSFSEKDGKWYVTAHKAFDTAEWMKVTIDGIVYDIVVTDATFTDRGTNRIYSSGSSAIKISDGTHTDTYTVNASWVNTPADISTANNTAQKVKITLTKTTDNGCVVDIALKNPPSNSEYTTTKSGGGSTSSYYYYLNIPISVTCPSGYEFAGVNNLQAHYGNSLSGFSWLYGFYPAAYDASCNDVTITGKRFENNTTDIYFDVNVANFGLRTIKTDDKYYQASGISAQWNFEPVNYGRVAYSTSDQNISTVIDSQNVSKQLLFDASKTYNMYTLYPETLPSSSENYTYKVLEYTNTATSYTCSNYGSYISLGGSNTSSSPVITVAAYTPPGIYHIVQGITQTNARAIYRHYYITVSRITVSPTSFTLTSGGSRELTLTSPYSMQNYSASISNSTALSGSMGTKYTSPSTYTVTAKNVTAPKTSTVTVSTGSGSSSRSVFPGQTWAGTRPLQWADASVTTGTITVNPKTTNITFYYGISKANNTSVQQINDGSITAPSAPADLSNGWTFYTWRTSSSTANKISSDVDAGESFTPTVTTYYAVYKRDPELHYNGNGATSGNPPIVFQTQYYNTYPSTSNTSWTAANNPFTKTGYSFSGWANSSTGAAVYSPGDSVAWSPSVSQSDSKTLYAVWNANTYSLSYVLNGGTHGGTVPSSATFDTPFTVPTPTRTGYTFKGWTITNMSDVTHYWDDEDATTSQGSATTSTDNKYTKFKNLRSTSGTVTFTANWERGIKFYYGVNQASYDTVKQTNSNNIFTPEPADDLDNGWTFVGWRADTTASTSGVVSGDVSISPTSTSYYAVYERDITQKYNGNGATSGTAPSNQTATQVYNSGNNISGSLSFTAATNPFSKTGSEVDTSKTWYTNPSGINGTRVAPGATGQTWSPGVNDANERTLYVIWSGSTYTLTADGNGGTIPATTGWTGSGSMVTKELGYNAEFGTLPSNLEYTGHTFLGWYDAPTGGSAVSSTSKMPAGNMIIYARWRTNTYTLRVNPEGGLLKGSNFGSYQNTSNTAVIDGSGSSGTPAVALTYDASNYATLGTAEKTPGYTFKGFYTAASGGTQVWNASGASVNGTSYWDSNGKWKYDNDITVHAQYNANSYTVTFDPKGGIFQSTSGTSTKSVTYDATTNNNPGKPTKSGSTFLGWYDSSNRKVFDADGKCTTEGNYWSAAETGVWKGTSDLTVYAKWRNTLTFDPNGGAFSGSTGTTNKYVYYESTDNNTPGAASWAGHTFKGWFDARTDGNKFFDNTGTWVQLTNYWDSTGKWIGSMDKTLYAQWSTNAYTISYAGMDGASYGEHHPGSASYDDTFTVDNPTKTGYIFNGWNITGMDNTTHTYGSSTTTNTSISGTTATTFKNLRASAGTVLFTATWSPIQYTITYNKNNTSATGSMSPSTHVYGTAKNLTNNSYSLANYNFNGWNTRQDGTGTPYTNGQSVLNLTTTNNDNITLYAQWAGNPYTISYTLNNGSFIDGSSHPTSTYVDTVFTVDHPERTGYTFGGWNITNMDSTTHYWDNTDASTSRGTSTTSNGNTFRKFKNLRSTNGTVSFAATWTANDYTVTFDPNGGTYQGSADPTSKTVSYDSTFNNAPGTPVADEGYRFKGWYTSATGNTQVFNSSGSYVAGDYWTSDGKWKATSGVTVFAQYEPITYNISYDLDGGSYGASHPTSATFGTSFSVDHPTKENYFFMGWNITGMDNTTHTYGTNTTTNTSIDNTNAVVFKNLSATHNATVSFKALWNSGEYTVSFDPTGGRFQGTTNVSTKTVKYNTTTNNTPGIPEYPGYRFDGWYTSASGGDQIFDSTGRYVAGDYWTSDGKWKTLSDLDVFAHWTAKTYYVHYNKNNQYAQGEMQNSTHLSGVASYLSPCTFESADWFFRGWNTRQDGQGNHYDDEAEVTALTDVIGATVELYAEWEPMVSVKYNGVEVDRDNNVHILRNDPEPDIPVTFSKEVRGTHQKVEGAIFSLKGTSESGLEVDEIARSDSNGKVTFNGIPWGTYTMTEQVNPEVDIIMVEEGREWTVTVPEGAASFTITENNVNINGVIDNPPQPKGRLEFIKIDTSGNRLGGAKFHLTGHSDYGTEINRTAYSSSNEADKGHVEFNNVYVGTYDLVEEEAPEAHSAPNESWTVRVEENSFTITKKSNGQEQTKNGSDYVIINKPYEVDVVVQKVDAQNNSIKLAKAIYKLSGYTVNGILFEQTSEESDKNGLMTFKNVPAGEYTLAEIQHPDRYYSDPDEHHIVVSDTKPHITSIDLMWNDDETALMVMNKKVPEPTGNLHVRKLSPSGDTLPNAIFTLTGKPRLGGEINLQSEPTPDHGVISFMNIPEGQYKLTEIEPPSKNNIKYSCTGNIFDVEVDNEGDIFIYQNGVQLGFFEGDGQATFDVVNYLPPSGAQFKLKKVDSKTGDIIPGVRFELAETGGDVIAGATTNVNGVALFEGVPDGTYSLTELGNNGYYDLDPITVVVENEDVELTMNGHKIIPSFDNETFTFEISNTPYPDFELNKIDENGIGLPNAEFILTTSDYKEAKYDIVFSSTNNEFRIFDTGTNTLSTDSISIDIEDKGAAFTNNGVISGDSFEHGIPEAGDKASIISGNNSFDFVVSTSRITASFKRDDAYYKKLITDPDGHGKITKVPEGNYIFFESKAPAGYDLDPAIYNVSISRSGITVTKGSVSVPYYDNGLEIVDVIRKIPVQIRKLNESGNAISGAQFMISGITNQNTSYGKESDPTNSSGLALYEEVPMGIYSVYEVSVPSPYVVSEEIRSLDIHYDSDLDLVIYKMTRPNGDEVTGHLINNVMTFDFTNYPYKPLKLLKLNDSGDPIPGVEFTVKNTAGTVIYDTLYTDIDGTIAFEGLSTYGSTVVIEETKAPKKYLRLKDSYTVNTSTYDITLTHAGTAVPTTTVDGYKVFTVTNTIGRFDFKLRKTDQVTGQSLASVKFTLSPVTDEESGAQPIEKITDANGYLTFNDLEVGEYKLTEQETPAGYIKPLESWYIDIEEPLDANTAPFTVYYGDSETALTPVKDGSTFYVNIPNQPGKLVKIRKLRTGTTDYVTGAKLALYDAANDLIDTFTTEAALYEKYLAPGMYKLVEEYTPESYNKAEDLIFTVNADGTVTSSTAGAASGDTVTMFDPPKTALRLTFNKNDGNGNPVKNALFELSGKSKTGYDVLKTAYSSAEGVVSFSDLEIGTYTLIEAVVPKGYSAAPGEFYKNLAPTPVIGKAYDLNTGEQVTNNNAAATSKIRVDFTTNPDYAIKTDADLDYVVFVWDRDGNFIGRTAQALRKTSFNINKAYLTSQGITGTTGTGDYDDTAYIALQYIKNTDQNINDSQTAHLQIEAGKRSTGYVEYDKNAIYPRYKVRVYEENDEIKADVLDSNDVKVTSIRNTPTATYSDVTIFTNITGDLGDITKNFRFTLEAHGLDPNTTYEVEKGSTTAEATSDNNGDLSYTFTLKDDESITIHDMVDEATYTIKEHASDHVASYSSKSETEGVDDITGHNNEQAKALTTSELVIGENNLTLFSNNRDYASITGLSNSMPPLHIALLVILLAILLVIAINRYFVIKRKKKLDALK